MISETVYALGIEAVDTLPHSLGVTAKFLSDLGVRNPSQLREMMRARKIQSPGA